MNDEPDLHYHSSALYQHNTEHNRRFLPDLLALHNRAKGEHNSPMPSEKNSTFCQHDNRFFFHPSILSVVTYNRNINTVM